MSLFNIQKTKDGKIKIFVFNKKILSFNILNKYRRIFNKRFNGLTREEIKYLLEVQFEKFLGYQLNIDNPQTFNEKIQWLKFYYHDPLMIKCADKVAVRDYVKQAIGEKFLVNCIGIYDNPDEIDFSKLPNKFALKVNWGSEQNIICRDKSKLNIRIAKHKLSKWLKKKQNLYYVNFEWQYKDIKPKIICEQYIEGGNDLRDYKFFCFNGKYKYLRIISRTKDNKILNAGFYDRDLNKMPFVFNNESDFGEEIPQLNDYNKMIDIVEKLAKPFPFVRVDMYEDINKNIYFGELTFTPGNGTKAFSSVEWDYKFGEELKLPETEIL